MAQEGSEISDDELQDLIRKAFAMVVAVGVLIERIGPVPSGELYARLMPAGMQIDTYNRVIDKLKSAGMITVKNHLITWIGPKREMN